MKKGLRHGLRDDGRIETSMKALPDEEGIETLLVSVDS